MLEVCGFTYDPTLDAYTNGLGGRMLGVDTIQAHTELWVAQWITETLPTCDPEAGRQFELIARDPTPAASTRRTT